MLTFVFRHPLILLLGVVLLLLGVYLFWRKHQMVLTGHLADGGVVRLIPHPGNKGGTTYTAVIDYAKPDGTKSEFETRVATSPPMHAVGEKLRVVYYPDSDRPDVLSFTDLFLFPWVCICTGIFILMMYAGFALGPSLVSTFYTPKLTDSPPSPGEIKVVTE